MLIRSSSRRSSLVVLQCVVALSLAACMDASNTAAPSFEASFAKAPSNPDVPVTTVLGAGLSYTSDNGTAYVNGQNAVVSKIQSIGDFEMSTLARNTSRRTRISFDQVLSGAVPFSSELVQSRLQVRRTLSPDGAGRLQDMSVGESTRVPFAHAFVYGGKDYRLAMNSNNHPQSEWALATCLSGSPCNSWRITPTGADGRNTAVLIQTAKGGVETAIAVVRMSFDITFTK